MKALLLALRSFLLTAVIFTPIALSENHSTGNRAVLAASTDCTSERFNELHGAFTLEDAYNKKEAENYNSRFFRLGGDKLIPKSSRYPLVQASQDIRHEQKYVGSHGVASPYSVWHLDGWRYLAPTSSSFRLALSQAMACETMSPDAGFGRVMRSWLDNRGIYQMYLTRKGERQKSAQNPMVVSAANLMLSIFDDLKRDSATSNPLIREFLRQSFLQMRSTELSLFEKKQLTITEGFMRQIEKLRELSLRKRGDLTEFQRELLVYFDKFSKEPQFSFLMHPLVTAFVNSTLKTGLVATQNRVMNSAQMQDAMRSLSGILGQNVNSAFIDRPELLSGSVRHGSDGPQLSVPDLNDSIAWAVNEKLKQWQFLDPAETDRRRKKMQDDLFTLLVSYDALKHAPSPQLHGVRENILTATRLIAQSDRKSPDGVDEIDEIDEISLHSPDQTHSDRDLLNAIARRANTHYSPQALANLHHLDAVSKNILAALNRPFSNNGYYKGQIKDLEEFLKSGRSSDLFRVLFNSPAFLSAAANALKDSGAHDGLASLLVEVSEQKHFSASQHERYRRLRPEIVKSILSTAFENLSPKERATMMAIALLDDFGLSQVTDRDTNRDPDRYHSGSIYKHLQDESSLFSKIATLSDLTPQALEKTIYDHAGYLNQNFTGLTPEIRQTLALRLHPHPALTAPDAVPPTDQLGLIEYAKSKIHDSLETSRSQELANTQYRKLVYNPITADTLDVQSGQHMGFDAYSYFVGGVDLAYATDTLRKLERSGFFEPSSFLALFKKYETYKSSLSPHRQALAESVLDYARALIERMSRSLPTRPQSEADQKAVQDVFALATLIDSALTPAVLDPLYEHNVHTGPIIEVVINDLLGDTTTLSERLASLWPKPANIQESTEQMQKLMMIARGLEVLRESNIGDYLKGKPEIDSIIGLHQGWAAFLSRALSNSDDGTRYYAQTVLDELSRYQRALTGVERAIKNSPDQAMPKNQLGLIRNYFSSIETMPKILAAFENDPATYERVKNTLVMAKSAAERSAQKTASDIHGRSSRIIGGLTRPDGYFSKHKIGYDGATNSIVISNDSYIDNRLEDELRKLGELGDFNLYIEPENRHVFVKGGAGFSDWLREKRYEYGYESPPGGEHFLPITDNTAVKVFRHGDGKYRFEFSDANLVRADLQKAETALEERRKAWIEAQSAYKSPAHASKAYFGAVIKLDPNNTSQSRNLDKSYADMMQALEWVVRAGHVKEIGRKSGVDSAKHHRSLIQEKLEDEKHAIEEFVSKVEVIHEITATLVSLPAGGPAESLLLKAAWRVKGTTAASRFASKALLRTARAARAYKTATLGAVTTAGLFTAVGTAAQAVVLGVQANYGNGPKLIQQKLALYKKNLEERGVREWRNYPDRPELSSFGIDPNNVDKASKNDMQRYHDAVFEYEIEETMDPDYDGIPENHDYLDRKIAGHTSLSELGWSVVDQFGGNLKFFQGLNLAKHMPLGGGGLPGEMALASVWANFHPTDPYLERVRRQEKARLEIEHERAKYSSSDGKKADTRERGLWEIAARDFGGGALEGFRFGVALKVPQSVMHRLPTEGIRGFGSRLLGTGLFIAADETLKYGFNSARQQRFENPIHNPEWAQELSHSIAIGGYIGYSAAKGAQSQARYARLKEHNLGITSEKPAANQSKPESRTTISDLIKTEFNGNEGQALVFLRTLTAPEIARAPEAVRSEFSKMMKSQGETAVKEITTFAESTNNSILKEAAQKLGPVISRIHSLNQKAFDGTLSAPESNNLKNLNHERNILLTEISQITEPMQQKAQAAQRALYSNTAKIGYYLSGKTNPPAAIENYQKNGALIDQAIIRLDTVKSFQGPIEVTTATLSPDSAFGKELLKDHQKARTALEKEVTLRRDNPTAWQRAADLYVSKLEPSHLGPQVSAEGYERSQGSARKLIVAARNRSTDAQEKQELLDILRMVDPVAAVKIEAAESNKQKD